MSGFNLEISQSQKQVQIQMMSQRQIQSLEILSLGSVDLRERIYKEVENNPALEIISDKGQSGTGRVYGKKNEYSYVTNRKVSAAAELASENFQAVLEAKPDERETLQNHLLNQINMMHIDDETYELCKKLIENLDEQGHHILAPESIVETEKEKAVLDDCIKIVQHLDPAGCAVKSVWESLIVQAHDLENANAQVLFLLNHPDFMNPPQAEKALKKINAYTKEQEKKFGLSDSEIEILKQTHNFTVAGVEKALQFIKSLNPFPAQNYKSDTTHFISPDVYVEEFETEDGETDFNIRLSYSNVPDVRLSSDFINAASGKSNMTNKDNSFINKSVKEAEDFLNEIAYRESTLLSAVSNIVTVQKGFFKKGSRYLVPFRQKDLANIIGVHESTISRMANNKYIQCKWGLFAIKYFFTTSINQNNSERDDSYEEAKLLNSKEAVKSEIAMIIEAHKNDTKKLSDQKITDILNNKGINIARRTVAKYRAEISL